DLGIVGTRQHQPDLDAAARNLSATNRDQNAAAPLTRQVVRSIPDIYQSKRTFEVLRDAGQVSAEAAFGIADVGDTDHEEIVALAGLGGDCRRIERRARNDVQFSGLALGRIRLE